MASQYNELQHSMWLALTQHCKALHGATQQELSLSIPENAAVKGATCCARLGCSHDLDLQVLGIHISMYMRTTFAVNLGTPSTCIHSAVGADSVCADSTAETCIADTSIHTCEEHTFYQESSRRCLQCSQKARWSKMQGGDSNL